MALPLRRTAAGRQQCQARALAIRLIEHFSQQPFALRQRLMTAGRGRSIDDDQP